MVNEERSCHLISSFPHLHPTRQPYSPLAPVYVYVFIHHTSHQRMLRTVAPSIITTRAIRNMSPQNIVVIGGGIAGSCTAYFASLSPHRAEACKVTLIEGTKIAAAASGYSGGFLAKDWHGSATSSESPIQQTRQRDSVPIPYPWGGDINGDGAFKQSGD